VETFLNLVISGIVTGAIYSIMASGLVLTYQTSGIFNFAHGAIAFATAYFYYQLHTGLGMPIVPAAILSVLIFAPVMGIALDAILLRRLAGAPIYARCRTSPVRAATHPASDPTRRTCTDPSAGSGFRRSTSTATSSRCSSPR
jgi:branched-subunit amino acid ABC-type transport system permease component